MRRAGEKIDRHFTDINRDLSRRLGGVGMKCDAALPACRADPADILDGPYLVVRRHNAHENRLLREGGEELIVVDEPLSVDGEVGHPVPRLLEPAAGVEDRAVLGLNRDDVVSLLPPRFRNSLYREVIGLGGAARENNFPRFGMDCGGYGRAGRRDRFFGGPAEAVLPAGGIPELRCEVREHRLQNAGVDRSRGMVIHVDGELHHTISMIVRFSNTLLILSCSFTSGSLMVQVVWMMQSSGPPASHWRMVTLAFSSMAWMIAETFSSEGSRLRLYPPWTP